MSIVDILSTVAPVWDTEVPDVNPSVPYFLVGEAAPAATYTGLACTQDMSAPRIYVNIVSTSPMKVRALRDQIKPLIDNQIIDGLGRCYFNWDASTPIQRDLSNDAVTVNGKRVFFCAVALDITRELTNA